MHVHPLFSTPLLVVRPALPEEVAISARERLIEMAENTPGIRRSNAGGGWHSTPDLFLDPSFSTLGEHIAEQARHAFITLSEANTSLAPSLQGLQIQAWGMVLKDGAFVLPHDHADAHLAGVLHLDDTDTADGHLALLDPRSTHLPWAPVDPTAFHIAPKAGQLVWFPAGLRHWVTPVRGRTRVSISVNVRFQVQHSAPGTT
jgi:hypothetical protein